MRNFLASGAAALALSLAVTPAAEAQAWLGGSGPLTYTSSAGSCASAITAPTWEYCAGLFAGNDNPSPNVDVISFIENTWTDVGLTNVSWLTGVGEYPDYEGSTTIEFGNTYSNFVLSLKAGNQNSGGGFGLYYYTGPLSQLELTMTASDQNLSHWNIYGGEQTTVPEPGTMLLLGTGLLGMAFARRREDVA